MTVLRLYPSPRGFKILPIHWSHDPEKTDEWAETQRAKYPTDDRWLQEMEIDFRSRAGNPATPSFRRELHLRHGLQYVPMLPLCLQVDFNVSPMIWLVGQIVRGKPRELAQIKLAPATIEDMVREFRNLYPAHPGEVWVYGDATGTARTSQTGKSDYELLKLAFRGYSGQIVMKVPAANPHVKDRLNATNRMLRGVDGLPGIEIDEEGCPDLVRDLEEVVLAEPKNPRGEPTVAILKVYDPTDPYHERTHALDGMSYWIWREWPVALEGVRGQKPRPRAPLKYGRMLGDG